MHRGYRFLSSVFLTVALAAPVAVMAAASPQDKDLSGHPKTGQWWSGQNRPTGRGRGLSCSTLQPAVEASPFSYANSEDHI